MTIELRDISKHYSGHQALSNVSMQFSAGNITGLLGPNGAGKTSLIRIINNIIEADKGDILVNGNALDKSFVAKIGYLPEERGLYKKMKVAEQIVYLARLKGLSKQEAKSACDTWLHKLNLDDWRNARIEQLSKGMAQKVQFISTVVHNPDILILDEPFSGFDPVNVRLIKDLILELKEEGKTIILSTHNMNSVEEICDHVYMLNQGKKILDGALGGIKEDYRPSAYEIQFRGNIIGFTNALWAGYELIERKQIGNENFVAVIKLVDGNTINNLLSTIIPHVQVERVEEILPKMDEIFIKALNPQPHE